MLSITLSISPIISYTAFAVGYCVSVDADVIAVTLFVTFSGVKPNAFCFPFQVAFSVSVTNLCVAFCVMLAGFVVSTFGTLPNPTVVLFTTILDFLLLIATSVPFN